MNAGLLFYQAHRTAICQQAVEKQLHKLDLSATDVHVCVKQENLYRSLHTLLGRNSLLVIISGTAEGVPLCAVSLFDALRIPLNEYGEPQHVKRLDGDTTHGYLVESYTQAILLLPDIPAELEHMLPAAAVRLAYKFGVELPPEPLPIDYEAMAELSLQHLL